ncbi:GH36 C-terminal domain-containing protein [Cohnella rhizosphaerae]|uniref:GH36 C-terminal domain-containing protein n=1 Tax=Cohnella rhizosphaerae TaxID=1457232 RepID=A0A9X4QRE1_9BACL|nr:GH36 C-terminal domain-containing protein [Cohnella rhizosphaerae]MDG0808946.1 GH36 C-terminal domain-containing protein [Cohnella rhizosphaerae]
MPNLPARLSDRLAVHTAQYRTVVRRFVREGDLYRLTAQPLREGRGSRWAAFQYALAERGEHLLVVFRLDGGEERRRIALRALDADAAYELEDLDGGPARRASGAEWMDAGLWFEGYAEEQSGLFVLRKLEGGA